MPRIDSTYREVKGQDGRTRIVRVERRYSVSTELKRKGSRRVRVVRSGEASVFAAPVALPRRGGAS